MHAVQRFRPVVPEHKARYIVIFSILLGLLLVGFLIMTISYSLDNTVNQPTKSSAGTSPGATKATGAPIKNTNTPADRTVPGPSGGSNNSLLHP